MEKAGKKNIFSGRILEIEGVEHLTCEQAFELSDASAERSAAACTVKLGEAAVMEYLQSNIVMLKWMLSEGYGDARTIERRVAKMQAWCEDPKLMSADKDAEYACTIDINLDDYTEPVLCAPNDPDDARLLSEVCEGWEVAHMDGVQAPKIDEVFIGSCMTNIGHFRAAGKMLKEFGAPVRLRVC